MSDKILIVDDELSIREITKATLEKYGYIEFRYAGGEIKEDVLVDKILYFCYLIYNMSEQNIDRKEYRKKLFMFLKNAI